MLKNIVFDLGNVILQDYPAIVLKNASISDEDYNKIKSTFFSNWSELDLGNETLKQHLDNCKLDISIDENLRELIINDYKYRPFNNEVIDLMNSLKSNGYNIFILSNNNKEAYEYLRNLSIFESVDGWIMSCDYHIVKPDKRLYIKLFETYNLKPEECFFIDDTESNILTAETLGMKGFTFDINNNGLEKLKNYLLEFNVVV